MSIWKLSTGKIVKNGSGKVVSCADCPCGGEPECDCCDNAASTWTVDFGAATLTDEDCNFCDQIAGEFVLSDVACFATYLEDPACTVDANTCNDGPVEFTIRLEITGSVASGCILRVTTGMCYSYSTTCSGGCAYVVVYEKTLAAGAGPFACAGTEHALTKVSEQMNEYDTGKQYCTGNYPATITVTGNA